MIEEEVQVCCSIVVRSGRRSYARLAEDNVDPKLARPERQEVLVGEDLADTEI